MLNSTKTWQEEFAEIIKPFCYEEYGKIYLGKLGEELRAEGILITIEQFISDLRKKDEEELIKLMPDFLDECASSNHIKLLIKDYYAK